MAKSKKEIVDLDKVARETVKSLELTISIKTARIKELECQVAAKEVSCVTYKDTLRKAQEKLSAIPGHVSHGIVLGKDGPRVYGNEEAINKVKEIIEYVNSTRTVTEKDFRGTITKSKEETKCI